jgi:cobalt transporter subunit CbtA
VLRVIITAAVIAGVIGGLFASLAQSVRVVPLILEAETYETDTGAADHDDDHGGAEDAWAPETMGQRLAATIGANLLAGVGFALLLTAGLALRGDADWYRGLLWGLAGFATFSLAPAVGLPPEIPGAETADLAARQLWWVGTAAATGAGLALILLTRQPSWVVLGALLIVIPHLVGAPTPDHHDGSAPEALAHAFVVATIVTNFLFWIVLGSSAGYYFKRFAGAD